MHAGQRAPRAVLRLPQFLRHAGLRIAAAAAHAAGESLSCRCSTSATSDPRRLLRGRWPGSAMAMPISSTAWCSRRTSWCSRVARFVDEAPWHSDYTFEKIYYRSIRAARDRLLTTRDYLWRWDTDWFWCSKNFGAQNPLVRRLLGRRRLNSRTYTRCDALEQRASACRGARPRWRGRFTRIGDPGRGHPDRRMRPSSCEFLSARDRDPADLDLPDPLPPTRSAASRCIR